MPERGQFLRPAPWGFGAGPEALGSITQAETAVAQWLEWTPDRPTYGEERERILALRQILRSCGPDPSDADLHSARLAIQGFVRFARLKEGRRQAAYASWRMTVPRATLLH